MKITEILNHISPGLRASVEECGDKLGAVGILFSKLNLFRESNLLRFAGEEVVAFNRIRRFHFWALPRDKRLLNIAERLVVAFRIVNGGHCK